MLKMTLLQLPQIRIPIFGAQLTMDLLEIMEDAKAISYIKQLDYESIMTTDRIYISNWLNIDVASILYLSIERLNYEFLVDKFYI